MEDSIRLVYKGQMPNLLCCDTMLRKMPNGDWVTVFLSGGYAEPRPENNVFITRSLDEGRTWSAIEPIFPQPSEALVPTELYVSGTRAVLFISKHDGHFWDWTCHRSVSDDSGYTWSELEFIPFKEKNTFIRNLLIRADNTWVLPYQHYMIDSDTAGKSIEGGIPFYRTNGIVSENGVMISTDEGQTWVAHDGVRMERGQFNWAENNVAELPNGDLVMLIRVDRSGVLYRSDSRDGGRSWSEAYPTEIPNPGTKFRLFNLKGGRIALIHNPMNAEAIVGTRRHPLSLWISDDSLDSWVYKRDLVTFPGELAYPDGFLDEEAGTIHFVFDYSRHDIIYVGARLPS